MNEHDVKSKEKPRPDHRIAWQWFRFYSGAIDDPKVQRLSGGTFKTWVNMLCLAASHDGVLPPVADIAFRLRMSDHDAQSQVDDLISLGLVDIRSDRRLEMHNWNVRQFVSDRSASRVRKYRNKNKKPSCNVTRNNTVTPPEAEAEAETEAEHNRKNPLSPPRGADGNSNKFYRRRRSVTVADFLAQREGGSDEA